MSNLVKPRWMKGDGSEDPPRSQIRVSCGTVALLPEFLDWTLFEKTMLAANDKLRLVLGHLRK